MEQLFFSKENFNIIYNILKNKIKTNTNVDIDKHAKFRDELVKIIKTIYKQRTHFNIPSNMSNIDISRYLSQKVINISINYFTETISQNNNHTNRDIRNKPNVQNINQIDSRPQATSQYNNGSSTVVNNFNRLLNERDQQPKAQVPPVNFKDNIQESNNDIQNKYKDLNSKRESDYELLNKTSGNSNITQEPEFKNMMPSNTLAQQNLIDNPSSVQIQHLLQQQKQLQEQINKFQRQENTTNFSYNHPSQISMNNADQAQQFKESQIKPIFNAPSQQNTQFLSDDNKPLTDILQSQFTALTSDQDNTMEPDKDIDYNLLSDITDEPDNLTDQFETAADGDKSIFPKKPFNDTSNNVIVTNNENPNLELDIIKESIAKQTTVINNTHNNIEKLVQLYQENDISKYYQTIQDIPRLIQEQKQQPLTIRTHNLIVSSRDRNLSNKDFDKYNFSIVFGAEDSQTITTIKNDNNNLDSNMNSVESEIATVFASTGLQNPSVSRILKNVISIKLLRVIIPKPRDDYHYPEPYFFVAVDEFNSNIISTKNFNEKIFCKIHFDKELIYNNNGNPQENRTYLYYKNDDDDFTIFYPSPLAKLDRLTLKLLDSEGINVKKSAMKDIDIDNPTNDGASYIINTDLYANTFVKDKLFIIPDNGATQTQRVTAIDDTTANNIKITPGNYTPQNDDTIINLTNQVEYIFEIKTQEPDPTNSVRPTNI